VAVLGPLSKQLEQHFKLLKHPVELAAALDDSPRSRQLAEFLDEVAALSELITVTRADDPRRPSFAISRVGTDVSVRFAAIPLGHEMTSFVLAVLQVGGHPSTTKPEILEQVRQLDGDYEFTTYLSLTCQNCPEVVQALNLMSVINPRIRHVAVDGSLFKAEVEARNVLAVPTVYLNGQEFDQGRMTIEQILAKLDSSAAEKAAHALADKDPFDMLVVGAGPAGVSAAIYAARKGIRTGIVAERIGGQVLDTMAIENLVSVPYTEGPQLATALEQHARSYDIDIMTPHNAVRLVPASEGSDSPAHHPTQRPEFHEVVVEGGAVLRARTVIIATGARWRQLGVPGEQEYRNHGVTYCPHCDGPLFKGKRVAVIGGGNSGVEAAIDLAGVTAHVTLLEFAGELRADEVLQRKLRSLPNADVVLNARTTEVAGDGAKVTGLRYADQASGAVRDAALDGVFVQIGLLPNTEWLAGPALADAGLEINERGEVVTDDRGATAIPGVFAAGDCATTAYKQIVTAFGSGSTAALSAFDHLIRTTADADAAVA
jgi:NADH-dependent peroxiredoxin subunit F